MEFWFARKHVLWVLINLISLSGYESCLDEERLGLLSIRDNFESNGVSTERVLPSWTDNLASDCCSWERVKCNNTTGRVIELLLNNTGLDPRDGWFLNVSLFLLFEELRSLDLHQNWFTGCYQNHGFEKISSLKKLEVLDLTRNYFQNNILQSLGEITSLRTLNLSDNGFEGSFPVKELKAIEHLETLDLSYNNLSGSPNVQDFKVLKNLIVLNLEGNKFNNTILPFVSTLTSLRTLNLGSSNLGASISTTELASLENLEELDLSYTSLKNLERIVEALSRLQKLEVLDLSQNNITKSSLKSLGALTSLKNLDLSNCRLDGVFPAQDLANLKNLELLNLSENDLSGFPVMLADVKPLKNLIVLNLESNKFNSSILPFLSTVTSLRTLNLGSNNLDVSISATNFGHMTSLKALSLADNNLYESLAQEGLCALKNLQELDLSNNNLSGIIPSYLGKLTSLRLLDLSSNKLKGDISSFPIVSLKSLEYVDLKNNLFSGQFSFYSIANHTNLEVLMLSSNNHKLEVQTHYSYDWLSIFQLKVIAMPNCRLNNIPQFLTHQTDLRVIDLSHNNLTETFPNWLLENKTQLELLSLRNNSIVDSFHLSPNSSFAISQIDISDNHFHGKIQQNIGRIIPRVDTFNLSTNAFDGGISSFTGSMPFLFSLDLSSNKFSGGIPDTLLTNSSNLGILVLSNNGLSGEVPKPNQTSLWSLQLGGNRFTGTLSNWISHYPNLHSLDISGNVISGKIPGFIGNLSLYILNMADNALEGTFPCELSMSSLYLLDISQNNLSGTLPSCLNWSSNLYHLNLEGNGFTGTISEILFNSSDMMTLNIGNNFLSGEIPTSIGNLLPNLRVLHLGGNNLSGLLPEVLCRLNQLSILDLSHNCFSGPIPSCFSRISFGKVITPDLAQFIPPFGSSSEVSYNFQSNLGTYNFFSEEVDVQHAHVDFVTKTQSRIYNGSILELMSGLDLSSNKLTGEIPAELGNLSSILAINLSHNQLTGSIPRSWGNLGQIESLDLSYNKLSGEIPSELITLNFLEVFNVSYNNFSGRLPDIKGQFVTFDNTSYEGNPFLCGPPLDTSCSADLPELPPSSNASNGKWHDIVDPASFLASFVATYVVYMLAYMAVLYVNPYWRKRWFMFIDNFIDDCHFMAFYTIPKLFSRVIKKA